MDDLDMPRWEDADENLYEQRPSFPAPAPIQPLEEEDEAAPSSVREDATIAVAFAAVVAALAGLSDPGLWPWTAGTVAILTVIAVACAFWRLTLEALGGEERHP